MSDDFEFSQEDLDGFVDEALENVTHTQDKLMAWEAEAEDKEIIDAIFRQIHTIKGNCGFFNFKDIEELTHRWESVLKAAKDERWPIAARPINLFLSLVDILKAALEDIRANGPQGGRIENVPAHQQALDEALFQARAKAGGAEAEPAAPLGEAAPAAEMVVEPPPALVIDLGEPAGPDAEVVAEAAAAPKVEAAAAAAPAKPGAAEKKDTPRAAEAVASDIRVSLGKLDQMNDLIGELVIAHNMLLSHPAVASTEHGESLSRVVLTMGKITRDLQEMAVNVRMIPVQSLFRRMSRLVHDVSHKVGKKVTLRLEGESTEIDKTVIETITDPLVHLLRNAVDHGIETPEQRREAGKDATGIITLSAFHAEGEVWIVIEDDGRGLNREKILAKAKQNGLVGEEADTYTDAEVYNLIFRPGFSTAEAVTDVSGRGVGMDVVKSNLQRIEGNIEISSRFGKGSRFALRIPLTLAIVDGMKLRVGKSICIIPMLSIQEAFTPDEKTIITTTPTGVELVQLRGEFFPILRLKEILDDEQAAETLSEGVLIIVESREHRFALFTDEILGQQQTVVKGLPEYLGSVRGATGCTILGDGSICVILDIAGLQSRVRGLPGTSGP